MKCRDNCAFYIKELDTCMFCDYHKDTDDTFLLGMKKRLGDDYRTYIDKVVFEPLNIPRCDEQEKEFDILKLDDEEDFCAEWSHKKISKRLHNHGVDHIFVDMWGCDEIAFILGINGNFDIIVNKVAEVLGIHKECIYYDYEHCFMILNLFQEKTLRCRENVYGDDAPSS